MPRGGNRPGAGRKAGAIERKTALMAATKHLDGIGQTAREAVTAAIILASVDEREEWLGLIRDSKTKFAALTYLTDKRDGKARQALEHSGPGGGVIPMSLEIDL